MKLDIVKASSPLLATMMMAVLLSSSKTTNAEVFCEDACVVPFEGMSCEDVISAYVFEGDCCSLSTDPETSDCVLTVTTGSCSYVVPDTEGGDDELEDECSSLPDNFTFPEGIGFPENFANPFELLATQLENMTMPNISLPDIELPNISMPDMPDLPVAMTDMPESLVTDMPESLVTEMPELDMDMPALETRQEGGGGIMDMFNEMVGEDVASAMENLTSELEGFLPEDMDGVLGNITSMLNDTMNDVFGNMSFPDFDMSEWVSEWFPDFELIANATCFNTDGGKMYVHVSLSNATECAASEVEPVFVSSSTEVVEDQSGEMEGEGHGEDDEEHMDDHDDHDDHDGHDHDDEGMDRGISSALKIMSNRSIQVATVVGLLSFFV